MPMNTHRFDIRIMIAQMILAGLVVFDNSFHPEEIREVIRSVEKIASSDI